MTVRVLVVDDQPLIRGGLIALLRAAPGVEPVGEARDGREAIALAREHQPDVILMDVRMPGLDGLEAARAILSTPAGTDPGALPRIVVLTTFDLDEYVYAALELGAAGFLLKDAPPEQLLAAIEHVVAGEFLVSPRVTRRLVETYATAGPPRAARTLEELTPRETEVLGLVGTGLSNAEIAGRLWLSQATVKTHVKRIMGKLALASRAQAVVVAYESGLVRPGAVDHDRDHAR